MSKCIGITLKDGLSEMEISLTLSAIMLLKHVKSASYSWPRIGKETAVFQFTNLEEAQAAVRMSAAWANNREGRWIVSPPGKDHPNDVYPKNGFVGFKLDNKGGPPMNKYAEIKGLVADCFEKSHTSSPPRY